jgi:transmembrane sensor
MDPNWLDSNRRAPPVSTPLHDAADWWVRLRDPRRAAGTEEQWLEWSDRDPRHHDAFARVSELGAQLGALDAEAKQGLVREFVPARTRRWWPFAIAASFVVACVAGGIVVRDRLRAEAVESTLYSTAVAADRNIALSDGSQIALGGATQLTTHYTRARRDVDLGAGEAYFQVAHDAARPFIVAAGKISIRAVGTAFNVRRTGERVTIAVAEGRVRVAGSGGAAIGKVAAADALEAVAGQQISFDPHASGLIVSAISPTGVTSWREHRLEFVNEPLDSVVANINRYAPRPLRLADAKLGTLAFTGTVDPAALDGWLRALPKILPVRVGSEAGQVTISPARAAR